MNKKIKTGISTACFYPMEVEKAIRNLAEHDVKYIEIFVNTYCEMESPIIDEIISIIKHSELKVVSMHPFTSGFEPFMLFTQYERRFNDSIEFHKRYFDLMNKFGAEIFVLHGAKLQSVIEDEDYYNRFASLRDTGKQFGITVAHENVSRCKGGQIPFLSGMIDYLDGDVGLVFDNKQCFRAGFTEQEFISALGENIVHMHVSDRSINDDCMPIGKGNLNIKSIIQLMLEKEFKGTVMVELYRKNNQFVDLVYESLFNLNCALSTKN